MSMILMGGRAKILSQFCVYYVDKAPRGKARRRPPAKPPFHHFPHFPQPFLPFSPFELAAFVRSWNLSALTLCGNPPGWK